MARSGNLDPLMASNFALMELSIGTVPFDPKREGKGPILDASVFPGTRGFSPRDLKLFLGFQSMSIPDVALETKEINEGNWPFTHKVPLTRMTTGDVTITQAVFSSSSDFYIWIFQALWGRGAPRRNLAAVHLDYAKKDVRRKLLLYNCVPVSWKPGTDFDASAAEVSVEELTFHVERMRLDSSTLMPVRGAR